MNGIAAASENRTWARAYFITFWVVAVLAVMNLVVAFVLDAFFEVIECDGDTANIRSETTELPVLPSVAGEPEGSRDQTAQPVSLTPTDLSAPSALQIAPQPNFKPEPEPEPEPAAAEGVPQRVSSREFGWSMAAATAPVPLPVSLPVPPEPELPPALSISSGTGTGSGSAAQSADGPCLDISVEIRQ